MSSVEQMVRGSIDMHVHHAPDAHMKRSVDALQAALQAEEAGMRAIVLKSHDYPTAPLASMVSQYVRKLNIFGSLCLNFGVGGLNTEAVKISAALGAKVIWMPTLSSAYERERRKPGSGGLRILDEKEKIVPEVEQILDIVKSYDMVLATGHVSKPEVFAVVDVALGKGIDKIIITHPLETGFGATLSIDEQRQIAEKGTFIEHCFVSTLPPGERLAPMDIVESVKAIGAERCILTTDLGQERNPLPAEGMRMMVDAMLRCGLSVEEIEIMVKSNPANLLGLV